MNIQAFRWDSISPDDCAVSAGYSTSLVQLPIHQDLTDDDLTYIIGVVRQALDERKDIEIEP